jgi:DNA repair protein RecO (recombination protein O)
MKQVLLQTAFVLHRRAYRETSFIVDLLTKDHGRVSVVAKGVRKPKSSSVGMLQPFTSLLVSWVGKGELMTLSQVDVMDAPARLHGECLFAGFYLNELIMALLEKWDPHPALFLIYAKTLSALQTPQLEESALRIFEKRLLEELGYGLLSKEQTFEPDKYYRFIVDHGFVVSELGDIAKAKAAIFSGRSLIALANEVWQDAASLADAKRLNRMMLASLLGGRAIRARELFQSLEEH